MKRLSIESFIVNQNEFPFLIRSPTPQQAAGIALAVRSMAGSVETLAASKMHRMIGLWCGT
jgi:hypothetical protein